MPQSGPKEGPCYRIEISEQEKNISDIEDECVIKRYAKQETAAAGLRGSRPSSAEDIVMNFFSGRMLCF